MCNLNKNKLLALFFQEGSTLEQNKTRRHVRQCPDCQQYLASLQNTDFIIKQWKDEKPEPEILDYILEKIPEAKPFPAQKKSPAMVFPLFMITLFAGAILSLIIFIKDKITLIPFWKNLEQLWIVRQLGSLGMTAILFILTGICITLLVTPVLIFESRDKKYSLKF